MSQDYPESDMAEKSNNETGMNRLAIDKDSSESSLKDNKAKISNSHSSKKRNNQFSENIFFYSYPFSIGYIKKTILSLKKNQKA
ncbi:MAG: hypothetical protein ACFE8U_18410 [Candidatus Hermodarchaeota archaeon]